MVKEAHNGKGGTEKRLREDFKGHSHMCALMAEERMWMVRAGREANYIDEFKSKKIIAIGWNEVGDLSNAKNAEEIKQRVRDVYPESKEGKINITASQIIRFRFDFKKGDQALELIKELESSLDKYGKYLPKKEYDKLKAVIEVSKSSLKGLKAVSTGLEVTSAVMELHGPLQSVVAILPVPIIGTTATAVTIIVIIVAVATGGMAAYNNYTAVEIIITNDGCQTIPILPAELTPYFEEFDILSKIIGMELPQEVAKDTTEIAKLRPEIIEVDHDTTTSIISVKTDLGEFPISIPTQTTSVKFNDMQILGQKMTIDLGESPTHQLVISCP